VQAAYVQHVDQIFAEQDASAPGSPVEKILEGYL
jgi:hypothetical protein